MTALLSHEEDVNRKGDRFKQNTEFNKSGGPASHHA